MKKIILPGLLLIQFSFFAQNLNTKKWRKTEKDSMEKAQLFYDEHLPLLSLPIFLKLQENHPDEIYLQYITGLCAIQRADVHSKALELLLKAYEKNKKIADIDYNLARAYHLNYKFDEALQQLEIYKKKNKKLSPKQTEQMELLVNYCNNAKLLVANPLPAKIENVGRPLNTEASEYVPIISSDEETMVYTYVGDSSIGGRQNAYNEPDKYGLAYEDVYITHKQNGQWLRGKSIGISINTVVNDAAVSLSADGQMLFIFKDDRTNNGDLYISYLQGNDWSFPTQLRGEVNQPLSWEGSCSLSADGKTLYFVSDRKGGFGGRDIYKATLRDDGSWGNVQNLGDKINTKYDDDAPFIHPDGITMVFSSCGHNSMGSYDIFKTTLGRTDSTWSVAENLGYPINSPDRDSYYVLSADGKHGYYASGKEGGQGLQDIYLVEPGLTGFEPALLLVKGNVMLNNKPIEADLFIEKTNEQPYMQLKSNAVNGHYLTNLPGGTDYKLIFKLKNFPDKSFAVEAMNINSYTEKIIDVNFDTLPAQPVVKNEIPKTDSVKTVTPAEGKPQINNGTEVVEGLFFRVQIAAYKLPENYSAKHLEGLGEIEKLVLEDNVTRFTIGGNFYTLAKAQFHRGKVKTAGQKDAFITAVYKGKRVYLDDLEKMGILNAMYKK